MKAFFKELFEYNNDCNTEIISVLTETSGKTSERCIEILSHIVNVHEIWNGRIGEEQVPFTPWKLHPIEDLNQIDRKNFEYSNLILDKFDLSLTINYTNSKGQIFNNSIRDILFQVINHSTYHRGQVATEFRQSGLEPLLTDYIYYKVR